MMTSIHAPDDCLPLEKVPLENMEHFKLELFTQEKCGELIIKVAPKVSKVWCNKKNKNRKSTLHTCVVEIKWAF
jgi:hypothetical protein